MSLQAIHKLSREFLATALCRVILLSVSGLIVMPGAIAQNLDYGDPNWLQENRFVEVGFGRALQNYREQDQLGLTPDGTLNTESGAQAYARMAVRWQTQNRWLFGLQLERKKGPTQYNGYLQTGSGGLTPYRTTTGNIIEQLSISMGYALPVVWGQAAPIVQLQQFQWQRNLTQYAERYRYHSYSAGILLQWRVSAGLVVETQGMFGKTSAASVDVPAFGFYAIQNPGRYHSWHVAASHDLSALIGEASLKNWCITARYSQSRYSHGGSPVVAGLQAPSNQHSPAELTFGLQKHF
jgi:hypothetical protein